MGYESRARLRGELMRVEWDSTARHWRIHVRNSPIDDWATIDGPEGELDDLLSIARDIITGG